MDSAKALIYLAASDTKEIKIHDAFFIFRNRPPESLQVLDLEAIRMLLFTSIECLFGSVSRTGIFLPMLSRMVDLDGCCSVAQS